MEAEGGCVAGSVGGSVGWGGLGVFVGLGVCGGFCVGVGFSVGGGFGVGEGRGPAVGGGSVDGGSVGCGWVGWGCVGGGSLVGGSVGDGCAGAGTVEVEASVVEVGCSGHVASGVNVGHKTHGVGAEPPLEDVVASAAEVALFVAIMGAANVCPPC